MNDKTGDDYPIKVIAEDLKLDINDSNTSVEFYKDLLLKIGLEFTNKYVNLMDAVKEFVGEVKKGKKTKGRKLPAGYKAILDSENELLALKDKSSELTNKEIALNKSIKEKKREIEISSENEYTNIKSSGRWSPEFLEEELKELQKSFSDISFERLELDFEIEDAEKALQTVQDKYSIGENKKQALPSVQKKGVFRKVKEASKEVEKSEMNPSERRNQIENTLKYNLFNAISARLPENFNLYDVAEILGLNEKRSIFATDIVLTSKMIKEGKKTLDVGDIEEEEFKPSFEEEKINDENEEQEAIDKEHHEEYAKDDEDNDDNLDDEGGEYGEEPEDDDYSY
jgi:hypothetical protein